LVPAIHVEPPGTKDVDARDKPGHDADLRQVAPAGTAAFLQERLDHMHRHATKCMFGVESLLPRNDTAITHFSALNRQGELFH
ncbi:hypothetical protein XI04_33975, partial [Bradyrhizobium sp. CCBAU 11430]|nr:hypothetical protein [Bradyrhizobium sp. CCBAU 21360]MDA9518018.1 hypothetical protein [Bradyrhizobium sp. CCBAU 11430]